MRAASLFVADCVGIQGHALPGPAQDHVHQGSVHAPRSRRDRSFITLRGARPLIYHPTSPGVIRLIDRCRRLRYDVPPHVLDLGMLFSAEVPYASTFCAMVWAISL